MVEASVKSSGPELLVGRYAVYHAIASGGMATVHLGGLIGPAGFSRAVAIKRLHSQYAKDPSFVAMFVDEAFVNARVRHPNVVPTVDIVSTGDELLLVMEYIAGENLARCLSGYQARHEHVPLPIVLGVMSGALHGLHAAHTAKNEKGEPLNIVHRDVSPQNILIGTDGLPRILDFGVAKAVGRMQTTNAGDFKGKLFYMPPEQLENRNVTCRADVFAAGIVLWETLTGERLFKASSQEEAIHKLYKMRVPAPSELVEGIPASLDAVVLRSLTRDPAGRYASALEMAEALEAVGQVASSREIAAWVGEAAREAIEARQQRVNELERALAVLPIQLGPGHFAGTMSEPRLSLNPEPSVSGVQVGSFEAPPLSQSVVSVTGEMRAPTRPLWHTALLLGAAASAVAAATSLLVVRWGRPERLAAAVEAPATAAPHSSVERPAAAPSVGAATAPSATPAPTLVQGADGARARPRTFAGRSPIGVVNTRDKSPPRDVTEPDGDSKYQRD